MFPYEIIGHILVTIITVIFAIKNKDKQGRINELEETNKRQRIEIVLQEEKIEELQSELDYQNQLHEAYVSKHASSLVRSEEAKAKIKSIRMEAAQRKRNKTSRMFKPNSPVKES